MKIPLKSLALRKSDPKLFASQVGSRSKTMRQMGSRSGSEKNSFGSSTLIIAIIKRNELLLQYNKQLYLHICIAFREHLHNNLRLLKT
jgi:hypothetical protein